VLLLVAKKKKKISYPKNLKDIDCPVPSSGLLSKHETSSDGSSVIHAYLNALHCFTIRWDHGSCKPVGPRFK